jgi:hypothetical protein
MKRCAEIFRIVIVSPETVTLLIICMIMLYFPKPFEFIGEKFESSIKLWEYIPVIPIAVFAFAISLSFQLHAPVNDANRELYDWDMYWALKYRIVALLVWTALSALCSMSIWLINTHLSRTIVGALFIGSLAVSFVAAATGILALFTLKEILTK